MLTWQIPTGALGLVELERGSLSTHLRVWLSSFFFPSRLKGAVSCGLYDVEFKAEFICVRYIVSGLGDPQFTGSIPPVGIYSMYSRSMLMWGW